MKTKKCAICGKEFKPTGRWQRYCPKCRTVAYEDYKERVEELKQYANQWVKDNIKMGGEGYDCR